MSTWQVFLKFFVSLRLTVVLLILSIILIFWATFAQVQLGVWGVQEHFFRTFFVLLRIPGTDIPFPAFPGGYFLGTLLLINLIAAHFYRFQLTWKKAGIQLTHFGLILLLLGELFTGLFQEEFQMRIEEGETKNYSESPRLNELAVIDMTDPHYDDVVAIPEKLLENSSPVQHPKLPFRVVPRQYFPNANLQMQGSNVASGGVPNLATQGIGPRLAVTPLRVTYRDNERNLPAAFVELVGAEGSIGTWLVSTMLVQPQTFEYAGRTWRIAFRFAREYKPFSLKLLELRHDIYPGSDIPKNFSSRVQISGADGSEQREALIYMNNPLRYQGLTFYQYQMDSANGFSVLQVVRNPSWLVPYIACLLMSVGLLAQFGLHLFAFAQRRGRRTTAKAATSAGTALPAASLAPTATSRES
jgi:hypothetical protein